MKYVKMIVSRLQFSNASQRGGRIDKHSSLTTAINEMHFASCLALSLCSCMSIVLVFTSFFIYFTIESSKTTSGINSMYVQFVQSVQLHCLNPFCIRNRDEQNEMNRREKYDNILINLTAKVHTTHLATFECVADVC